MKKSIMFSSLFIAFIFMFSMCFKHNKEVILGDYVLCPLSENKINQDTSFSNKNLTSDLLLEYLDYNAENLKTNIKINSLIKKSKKIYLSVGMNDLLSYINIDNNKLVYNATLINQKLALLEYNVNEIISSILAVKNVEIYYISLYYLNDEGFDGLVDDYNSDMKELLEFMGVNFIDINEIIKIENYTFSIYEQDKIYEYLNIGS